MFPHQPLPQEKQTSEKTQLDLTQLTLTDPNYVLKKLNIPPIEYISGEKLTNLAGDWMISVENTTQHNTSGQTTVTTLQAYNVKTKVKKNIDTLTHALHKGRYNGALHNNGKNDMRSFGDWIVVTIREFTDSKDSYSIQAYNIQTGEKKDFGTRAEEYSCVITITALNAVWGAMICQKGKQFANHHNITYALTLFNVQTGAIKTLSTDNKKNISLDYHASFHSTIIYYQDDTGMHIFDCEQGKELQVLPEHVEEIPTIKPTTKDYLESISKADPSVKDIIAANLQLGDVLVITLINALPQLKALQRLDLRGNKLTDESAKYLYMAVQKYPQLLEIQLDNNAISADWLQAIAERLKRNQPKSAKAALPKKIDAVAPHEYFCSLSLSIMLDPMMAPDGETYEREEIEKWMEKNNTSPITRAPFISKTLTPNKSIKKLIQDFLVANPDTRKSDQLYLSKRLITQCINAIKTGDGQALMQALDQDIRLLTMPLDNEQNLLLLACQQNNLIILKMVIDRLVQQNLLVQVIDSYKFVNTHNELLEIAVKHTGLEGAKLLAQAFKWSWVDLEQRLFAAIQYGNILLFEILIKQGAPLHHWNAEGQTPLHYAVMTANIEMIKGLVELGADTKVLNIDKQRPDDLARALGKPELALAIEAQKQQRKLAGVIQPLNEQISLLQEENKLLRQCMATMVSGMSAASNNTTDLSKHLIQSFSQFSQHSTGLKSQASSNNPTAPQTAIANTSSNFFQPSSKIGAISAVINDNYSSEKVEKLLRHYTQDDKDVVLSPMVDTVQHIGCPDKYNIQLFTKHITDFLKQRAHEIKTQQKGDKRLIIPLSVNNQFVSVCIMFKTKTLQESPCITYVDSKGGGIVSGISEVLQSLFPQSNLIQAYNKSQTSDNNHAPWMIETVRSILENEAPLNPVFDIEKAKSEHEKILMSQTAKITL